MTLHISITPEIEAKLRASAAAEGKQLEAYAAEVIARGVTRASLDELLQPLRQEVEHSGLSEGELADILEKAKHDMRRERPQVASGS